MSSKINFTKAEQEFDKAAEARYIENLFDLADLATKGAIDSEESLKNERRLHIKRLQNELKRLKKDYFELFQKLELTTKEENLLTQPLDDVSDSIWQIVQTLKDKLTQIKSSMDEPSFIDQKIEAARRKRTGKHFNIPDKWLPL